MHGQIFAGLGLSNHTDALMHLLPFFQWLSDTQFSNVIRGSVWAEPIIETVHVLTLTLFMGFAVLLDLRLLGLMLVRQPVTAVLDQLNRWLRLSFIIMVVAGLLLFSGDPVSFWNTGFFRLKMILLFLALVNVLVFNATVGRKAAQWDLAPKPPAGARVAALLSLLAWIAIIAAGRAIAYTLPPPI